MYNGDGKSEKDCEIENFNCYKQQLGNIKEKIFEINNTLLGSSS